MKYAYQRMKHNMQLRNGASLWPLNEGRDLAFRQEPTLQNNRPVIHQLPMQDTKRLFKASDTFGAMNLKQRGPKQTNAYGTRQHQSLRPESGRHRQQDRPKYISVNQLRDTLMARPRREIESAFYPAEYGVPNADISGHQSATPSHDLEFYEIGYGELANDPIKIVSPQVASAPRQITELEYQIQSGDGMSLSATDTRRTAEQQQPIQNPQVQLALPYQESNSKETPSNQELRLHTNHNIVSTSMQVSIEASSRDPKPLSSFEKTPLGVQTGGSNLRSTKSIHEDKSFAQKQLKRDKSHGLDVNLSYESSNIRDANDIQVYNSIGIPSINQAVFTNQAIQDGFVLKLQRSDQDLQVERSKGEALILKKSKNETFSDNTKTLGLGDTTNEMDTRELDVSISPNQGSRRASKKNYRVSAAKAAKYKKKAPGKKRSAQKLTNRNLNPAEDEEIITLPMEVTQEEVTTIEHTSQQNQNKIEQGTGNIKSRDSSVKDQFDINTFSYINSDGVEELPKNKREALIKSSKLQQKYAAQSGDLQSNQYSMKKAKIKKILKVNESDRQQMIIEATMGSITPQNEGYLLAPRILREKQELVSQAQATSYNNLASLHPRTIDSRFSQPLQPNASNSDQQNVSRGSLNILGRNKKFEHQQIEMRTQQQCRTQSAVMKPKLSRLHPNYQSTNPAGGTLQTREQTITQTGEMNIVLSDDISSSKRSKIVYTVLNNRLKNNQSIQPGSVHKSRRSLAKAVKSKQINTVQSQQRISHMLLNAQFKVENQKHQTRLGELRNTAGRIAENAVAHMRLQTPDLRMSKTRNNLDPHHMIAQSKEMEESVQNQRVYLNRDLAGGKPSTKTIKRQDNSHQIYAIERQRQSKLLSKKMGAKSMLKLKGERTDKLDCPNFEIINETRMLNKGLSPTTMLMDTLDSNISTSVRKDTKPEIKSIPTQGFSSNELAVDANQVSSGKPEINYQDQSLYERFTQKGGGQINTEKVKEEKPEEIKSDSSSMRGVAELHDQAQSIVREQTESNTQEKSESYKDASKQSQEEAKAVTFNNTQSRESAESHMKINTTQYDDEKFMDSQLQSIMRESIGDRTEDTKTQPKTVAEKIDFMIEAMLDRTKLNKFDLMTEDELIELKFERMGEVYTNIMNNQRRYGYTRSPDFKFKSELLQRQKQKTWMEQRGKTPESQKEKTYLRNGLDFVKVQAKSEKYSVINKNDFECYFDPQFAKTNDHFSQDYNNSEIIRFCSYLFHQWLEDYEQYAQLMMKRNLTHHHYQLHQTVQKNIEDKCLPIDYFLERMLQVGICSSMSNMRRILDLMLQFDNAGFVERGPDNMPSYIETPLLQTPRSESEPEEKEKEAGSENSSIKPPKQKVEKVRTTLTREEYDQVPWAQPYKDSFMPMNYPSLETSKFLGHHLHKDQFQITDRISMTQFLSLFNVIGIGNAKKLDKLTQFLKKEASEHRLDEYNKQKLRANMQKRKEIKKEIEYKMGHHVKQSYVDYEFRKLSKYEEQYQQQLRNKFAYIYDLKNRVTPMQRKIQGVLVNNVNRSSLLKKQQDSETDQKKKQAFDKMHFTNQQLEKEKFRDEHFYNTVMNDFKRASGLAKFIKEYDEKTKVVTIEDSSDDGDDNLVNEGTLINPKFILDSIKGNVQELVNKKTENLLKLYYEKQDVDESDLISKSIEKCMKRTRLQSSCHQNMPTVKEELYAPGDLSSSRSSLQSPAIGEGPNDLLVDFTDKKQTWHQLKMKEQEQQNSPDYKKKMIAKKRRRPFLPNNFIAQSFNQSAKVSAHTHNIDDPKINPQNVFVKRYTLNERTIKNLKDEANIEHLKNKHTQLDNKYKKELARAQNQLDIIRKQMITIEICKDLQKMQEILAGLLKYDSTNKIYNNFGRADIIADEFNSGPGGQSIRNTWSHLSADQRKKLEAKKAKVGSTLTVNEALEKRQMYRKLFREFIMIGIRDKYSKQMGLFYSNDEQQLSKNIYKGATVDMDMDPKDYGIKARTHLLKIASLMVKHNIQLTKENYIDPCHFPKSEKDKPKGKAIGVLGWLIELSQHDDIRSEMNKLTNLILEQIHDRDRTFSYPNEQIDEIMNCGEKKWIEEIDPINELIVPRRCLDSFLCKYKICSDYKQVNRFLSGVLSGAAIKQHEDVKKTHYMKLIYKAALRECIRNIITYNKFGFDTDFITLNHGQKLQGTVPFSHQILRFQRYVLFCGIKTKNSTNVPTKDRNDFLERSNACSSIVTHLQDMKQNKKLINADSCKIELETLVQDYKRNKMKSIKGTGVLNDLSNTAEWDAYIASNPDKLALFESFKQFQAIYNKPQPDHLAQLQAEAYRKSIYRGLIDPQENQKEAKFQDASLFSPKSGPKYLPQVQAAMRIHTNDDEAEMAKLMHGQQSAQLDHNVNKFSFGEPQNYVLARRMQKLVDVDAERHTLDPLGEFEPPAEEPLSDGERKESSPSPSRKEQSAGKHHSKVADDLKEQYETNLTSQHAKRVSLVERQTYRSKVSRELLKKAIQLNQ